MKETNKKKFEKEKSKNEEELKKVNSFSIFIEKKIKEGKFLYGKTGFTMIGKKIEDYEENMENMTEEELKEILDLFENMTDSFDKKENSIGEAFCLAHIIYINHTFFNRGYDKLWKHINRIKTLLFSIQDKYDWAEKAKQTIKKIEEKKTTDGQ